MSQDATPNIKPHARVLTVGYRSAGLLGEYCAESLLGEYCAESYVYYCACPAFSVRRFIQRGSPQEAAKMLTG